MAPKIKKCVKIHYWKMKPSKVKSRHFVIPYKNGEYIIYVPKRGFVALVNEDFVNGIQNNNKKVKSFFDYVDKQDAVPTLRPGYSTLLDFTLLLTSDCNMNCVYCYAKGGDISNYLSWETAKTSLDYGIKNSSDVFNLFLHGAGEPFLAFDLMKKSFNYAKQECSKLGKHLNAGTTSNGTFDKEKADWLIENDIFPLLSFDGPPDIQNKQRPLRNGKNSYPLVKKTIEYFNNAGKKYAVSTTFTKQSKGRLLEILKHHKSLGIKKIAVSPCYSFGRAKDHLSPNLAVFADEFLGCIEYAEKNGLSLRTIYAEPYGLSSCPCNAAGKSVQINPQGDIVSCFFATDKSNIVSNTFIYGRVKNGKVQFDKEKLKNLRNCTVHNMSKCQDCFCKYLCGGGCPYRNMASTGSLLIPDSRLCEATKKLVTYYLGRLVTNKISMADHRILTEAIDPSTL